MAKGRLFELPETKGAFQIKGIVSGMEKDKAYVEKTTKTGKPFRSINFGVEYANNETLYTSMQGMEQENVYFSKRDPETKRTDTQKVPWADRFDYNRDGYRLIGKNIGVSKKINSEGKTVNDKKVLTDFDACHEIKSNLKDGSSVFIRGNIDYSSYKDDKGNKRTSTKLVPNQVSLLGSDIDFADESYEKQNDFNQVIIFMSIEKEKDGNEKDTGRAIVLAKIVTYNNIEDVQFVIEDSKLMSLFRKNLKPYTAIKVNGHMVSSTVTEEVTNDDDEWGESDAMEKVSAPTRREFIITGAKPSTIDTDTYSQKLVEDAIAKIRNANNAEANFGSTSTDDDWGDVGSDDEEEAW